MRPLREWWGRASRAKRTACVVVGLVVAVDLLLGVAGGLAGGRPGGPTSSSYATGQTGMAAWFELLQRSGHTVFRRDATLDDGPLPPGATLIVVDPGAISRHEQVQVANAVRAGARLVVGGPGTEELIRRLVPGAVLRYGGPFRTRVLAPADETAGVALLRGEGHGSLSATGGALPVAGAGARVSVAVAAVGRGRVVLLADPSMLWNRRIAQVDNAALALAVVGPRSRRVVFAESVHGYAKTGGAFGLGALPGRWPAALAGGAAVAVAWAWSRGRRFGPPTVLMDGGPPPRRAYVEAVGASLAATHDVERATAPLRARARRRLLARVGLQEGVTDEAIYAAAVRHGLDGRAVATLLSVPATDHDAVVLANAARQLEVRS